MLYLPLHKMSDTPFHSPGDDVLGGHHSISRGGGGGWNIFEINNLWSTRHEINNLLQELFCINM